MRQINIFGAPLELDPKVNVFTSPDHQLTEHTVLEVLREATTTGVLAKLGTDPDTAIENARGARELLRQLDQDAVHRANQRAQQCVLDVARSVTNQGSLKAAFLNLGLGVEKALDVRCDQNSPVVAVIPDIAATSQPLIQRGVIPAITQAFPEVQLVASSCSPMILTGLDAGQIHVIQGEVNRSQKVVSNQQSTRGWTADEVLRVYLGVDHPTDATTATTADAARELHDLLNQKSPQDPKARDQRDRRIAELRRMANPTIEHGSPRAAEDARFLACLKRILAEHTPENQAAGRMEDPRPGRA